MEKTPTIWWDLAKCYAAKTVNRLDKRKITVAIHRKDAHQSDITVHICLMPSFVR